MPIRGTLQRVRAASQGLLQLSSQRGINIPPGLSGCCQYPRGDFRRAHLKGATTAFEESFYPPRQNYKIKLRSSGSVEEDEERQWMNAVPVFPLTLFVGTAFKPTVKNELQLQSHDIPLYWQRWVFLKANNALELAHALSDCFVLGRLEKIKTVKSSSVSPNDFLCSYINILLFSLLEHRHFI